MQRSPRFLQDYSDFSPPKVFFFIQFLKRKTHADFRKSLELCNFHWKFRKLLVIRSSTFKAIFYISFISHNKQFHGRNRRSKGIKKQSFAPPNQGGDISLDSHSFIIADL